MYQQALTKWGPDAQINMAIEEAGELIVVLQHFKRNRATPTDVCSEIADIEIMAQQLRYIFGSTETDRQKVRRLDRLQGRINGKPGHKGTAND